MQNLRKDRTKPINTIKFTPNSIKYIFYMSILNEILIYIHIRIARHFVVETCLRTSPFSIKSRHFTQIF